MPLSLARRRLVFVAALALLPVAASTTAVPPADARSQEQPTTLVTVEFRVLTRDGTPIVDLKPEEVSLKVGGRAREVVALELVKAGTGTPARAAKAPPAPPPPYLTNASLVGGRSVMLVIDDEAVPAGQEAPLKDALGQLIAALTPEDHVGLMTLKGGVIAYPSARHDRVLQDIASLRVLSGSTDVTCRTRMVHDALMNQFESAVPSVPTVVLLASSALAAPSTTTLSAIGNVRTQGSATGSACDFTPGDLATLSAAAVKSRVHVYGLEASRGAEASGGMENFANLTGNTMVRLSGDTKPAMQRIASETLAYYVAAFEVTEQERTGSTQGVAVTVNRQGVQVKAQPTVVVPKPAVPGAKIARPKLGDLLSAAKTYRDLPLRATVYTSRIVQPGKLSVVCAFDSDDPAAKITEASVILVDTAGKVKAQWTGQAAAFKARPSVAMFSAPGPGAYRMRLAAIDAAGAAGTINEDVRIEAVSPGTPQVSALVLGTQAASGFAPRLEFVDEKVATAVVEVYGVTKASEVAVTFEFAESENAPAAASAAGTVQAPRDDLRIAFVGIPAAKMPPGDLVVRAVITVDGQAVAAKPFHTLRKVER